MENILTYITETCLDPKIWGLFMCTSKWLYDNLIERFLVTKFKCMLVKPATIDCSTYNRDRICKQARNNHHDTILTANPFLVKAHATMVHLGIYEILGFYIPYLQLSCDYIFVNFEKAFFGAMTATFSNRIPTNLRIQLNRDPEENIITLEESRDITKEIIDTHYWNYSKVKLNDPDYIKDIEVLNNDYNTKRNKKRSTELLSVCRFQFPHHIRECICCGETHPFHTEWRISERMKALSFDDFFNKVRDNYDDFM